MYRYRIPAAVSAGDFQVVIRLENCMTSLTLQMEGLELDCMQHFGEERRLLYVAITRAKEQVYIVYDRNVPFADEPVRRSSFLLGLVPEKDIRRLPVGPAEGRFSSRPKIWPKKSFRKKKKV